ncbi:hypothetical protein HY380_02540 [Candidatus Saccharibacteria bacterium]|nr:hypothetical protein [Candidatus Saccharibacteria bacterium]
MKKPFTIHRSPFAMRSPFSVIRKPRLMANVQRTVNSEELRVNGSGYITLITVVIVGTIVTTTAIFLLLTGSGSSLNSQAVASGSQAKAAAEACIDLGLGAIQANPSLNIPANGNDTIDAAGGTSCSYTISGSSPQLTINATGTVDQNHDFVRKIRVTTSQLVPQIIISSWQDLP